jgi:hypothetical protein
MSRLSDRKRASRSAFPPTILVGFACNHGDNGLWRGTVEAMSIHAKEESLDLECSNGTPPRLTVGRDWLRFLRRRVPVLGGVEWYGNWCWNAYRVSIPDAATLLCAAVQSEKFTTDGARGNAACDLSDLLKANAPHALVADYLLRMAVAVYPKREAS